MNYHYYQIQDFLNDDKFVSWVLLGENENFWQHFLKEFPEKSTLLNEARQLILDLQKAEGESLPDFDLQRVWSEIQSNKVAEEKAESTTLIRKLWQQPVWRWAASIIIMLSVGWLVWQNQDKGTVSYEDLVATAEDKDTLIEKINDKEAPLKISLEDGSVILLEKNSRLSYPLHFEKEKRTVFLSGEASFDIAKDHRRPFYVYANEVVTKVLGTSFRIRAMEGDQQVSVKVSSGRVSVFQQKRINLTDPETKGVILLPNQQVVYSRETENFNRKLVEVPMPIIQPQLSKQPVRYEDVSVIEVLKVIEARYGVKVLYNEEALNGCVITTALGNESLYDKLDLICGIIGATYKEVDAQIVIESKGCK